MAKTAKKISGVLLVILLIAGVVLLSASLVVTREDEYTLIKQFGKIERTISEAGLSFKTPFLETTETLPKKMMFYDTPPSDVITMDKKTMVSDSYVLWRVSDPVAFAQTLNSSVTLAETRINTTVYNAMKNVISSLSQNDVISGRDGELDQAFMDNIGNSMDNYGIELISVETKHLDLPSDNKAAVYDRMISERAQMAATYTAEGESEAQKIRNTTDKEIAISISNAQTKAAKIIAEGEAEYMRILSDAYSNSKRSDFYAFIRSLEAAKASLTGEEKTLILSKDSPIAQIFYQID
ncbi:MAG: protease modulator HflC [Lachnospiraceae bacterium]|jgi:membrane protease subunit HflC|nr:protease modulator HflC [Lachnospiraceae bacterium]